MQLWIGLGNPGDAYAAHRHNVGFQFLAALRGSVPCDDECDKFFGRFSTCRIGDQKVLLLRPQTYMNRSGIAAAAAATFYKIAPSDVTVFHDDLDIAVGEVRVKTGGGHGGHNGLKSLDAHLSAGYRRIRIGIGHPGDRDKVDGWVLGRFDADARARIDATFAHLLLHVNDVLSGTLTRFVLP